MGFRYVSPVTQKSVMLDWELTQRISIAEAAHAAG